MPQTFAAAKTRFSSYGATVGDQINRVLERAHEGGKWLGTIATVRANVYDFDDAGVTKRQFTLPRDAETALGVRFDNVSGAGRTSPRPIHSHWYTWLPGRCTGEWNSGIIDLGDVVIFRDLPSAGKIKVYNSTTESSGSFHVRGLSGGAKAFTGTGGSRIEGEDIAMPTTNGASTLSATTFDAGLSLYAIVKPSTNGVVRLYHVAADSTETLIGVYEPGEKVPAWRRYQIPTGSNYETVLVKAKRRFVEMVADNDIVFMGSTALFFGLKAFNYWEKHNDDKAPKYFEEFWNCLNGELREHQGNAPLVMHIRPGEGFGRLRQRQ